MFRVSTLEGDYSFKSRLMLLGCQFLDLIFSES